MQQSFSTFIADAAVKKVRVFVPGDHFKPSLMFVEAGGAPYYS
jgi:hypothetical protein